MRSPIISSKVRSSRALAASLLLACFALPVHAQLYKWTDANGRTQYSDKPPVSAKSVTEVKRGSGSPVASAAAEKGSPSITDQEQAFRKRQMERQEGAQKQAKLEEEQRKSNEQCQRARQYLVGLEQNGRQARYDAKGERYFLDDSQIAREKATARSDVNALCK